jgi:hypothetical protein
VMMDAENSFDLLIQADFIDILHANRLYRAFSSDYYVRFILGFTLIALSGFYFLIAVLFFIMSSLNNQPIMILGQQADWIIFFAFLTGLIILFDLIPYARIWLAFKSNPQYYAKSIQATFTDKDITIQGEGFDSQYQWNFFLECIEGHREFILVKGKDLYWTIPKKALQDVDSFRAFITRKIPKYSQRLKFFLDFPK